MKVTGFGWEGLSIEDLWIEDLEDGIEDHCEKGGGMNHTMVECGTTAGEWPRGVSGS